MNNSRVSVLRPGYLVALSTSIRGGISYVRRDIATGLTLAELTAQAEAEGRPVPNVRSWETTCTISDPVDYEAATVARNKASALVRSICVATPVGLLCPEDKKAELDALTAEAVAIVAAHNTVATDTRVAVYCVPCRMAGSDEIAASAIVRETRDLLDGMERAIASMDVTAIRKSAGEAQKLALALAPEQGAIVGAAVKAARDTATTIRRMAGDGADAAKILEQIKGKQGSIESARVAFADLDIDVSAPGQAMPAVDLQRFDLDVDAEATPVVSAEAHAPPSVDLDDTDDAPKGNVEPSSANVESIAASGYTADLF